MNAFKYVRGVQCGDHMILCLFQCLDTLLQKGRALAVSNVAVGRMWSYGSHMALAWMCFFSSGSKTQ